MQILTINTEKTDLAFFQLNVLLQEQVHITHWGHTMTQCSPVFTGGLPFTTYIQMTDAIY